MTSPSTDYRIIQLTQGQVAIVDVSDFDWLNQWKWRAQWNVSANSFYAAREQRIEGRKTTILMHRLILGLEAGDRRRGDHQDHNTLNNRRFNLRIATVSQNEMNCGKSKNNKSGYKGVSLEKSNGKYKAQIRANGKNLFLGYRDTAREAWKELYIPAVEKYHGEFGRTQ